MSNNLQNVVTLLLERRKPENISNRWINEALTTSLKYSNKQCCKRTNDRSQRLQNTGSCADTSVMSSSMWFIFLACSRFMCMIRLSLIRESRLLCQCLIICRIHFKMFVQFLHIYSFIFTLVIPLCRVPN